MIIQVRKTCCHLHLLVWWSGRCREEERAPLTYSWTLRKYSRPCTESIQTEIMRSLSMLRRLPLDINQLCSVMDYSLTLFVVMLQFFLFNQIVTSSCWLLSERDSRISAISVTFYVANDKGALFRSLKIQWKVTVWKKTRKQIRKWFHELGHYPA